MSTTRADLLALTQDSLVALANRGLVKRATKDLDAGAVPEIEVGGDGTVLGRFADDVTSTLPAGAGLDGGSCTCAAPGICRHRVGLVLAYQRQFAGTEDNATPAEFAPWSPGSIDDETLSGLLGARTLAAARRAHRAGYPARLRRPTAEDPVATVYLPSCTVRFLVPGELGYVHTDATASTSDERVVLAVWAFREADERGLSDDDVQLDVGGGAVARARQPGMESAVELVDELLLDGARHASPELGAALRRAWRDLDARNLRWPASAMADVVEQLETYRSRSARYRAERFAELLTEIHARHRAVVNGGASLRSRVLGTDEPAETPLRRVRLTSLGCRITGTDDHRTGEVFLAHPDSATILVLRKRWELREDEPATGHDLGARRINGSSLHTLARANIVSESAARSASRVVRLASSRVARTTVTTVGTAWTNLPDSVLARDLDALGRDMAELAPRLVRPRVEAELVRVLEIAEVHDIGYDPGDQRLDAVFSDTAGTRATVSAEYRATCPAALDSLAYALDGKHGRPRFVSGSVRRVRGSIVVRPIAVMTDEDVIVPDLAPGDGSAALDVHSGKQPDPLADMLEDALAACAEAAHRGLRHATPGLRTRIEQAGAGLARVGLHAAADLLATLSTVLNADDEHRMVRTWVDAQLRLTTTAEFR